MYIRILVSLFTSALKICLSSIIHAALNAQVTKSDSSGRRNQTTLSRSNEQTLLNASLIADCLR